MAGTRTETKAEASTVNKDDQVAKVGETAGKIWRHLHAGGGRTLAQLAKQLDERPERVTMAVGWLAREDKVVVSTRGSTTKVALKENAESW
jgi:hypothetical protein